MVDIGTTRLILILAAAGFAYYAITEPRGAGRILAQVIRAIATLLSFAIKAIAEVFKAIARIFTRKK